MASLEGWRKKPNSNILNDFYDFSLFTSIFYLSLSLPLHFSHISTCKSRLRRHQKICADEQTASASLKHFLIKFYQNVVPMLDENDVVSSFIFRWQFYDATSIRNFQASSSRQYEREKKVRLVLNWTDVFKSCPRQVHVTP